VCIENFQKLCYILELYSLSPSFYLSLSHQFVLLLQYVLLTDIVLNLVQLRIVYDLFELYITIIQELTRNANINTNGIHIP